MKPFVRLACLASLTSALTGCVVERVHFLGRETYTAPLAVAPSSSRALSSPHTPAYHTPSGTALSYRDASGSSPSFVVDSTRLSSFSHDAPRGWEFIRIELRDYYKPAVSGCK
jgi:hypothetical protein